MVGPTVAQAVFVSIVRSRREIHPPKNVKSPITADRAFFDDAIPSTFGNR